MAPLPQTVAEVLQEDFFEYITVVPAIGGEQYQLRSKQFVGTIRIENYTIIVKPKIPLINVFALMEVETKVKRQNKMVGLSNKTDLLNLMAKIFCETCEQVSRRGINKTYRTEQDRLASPRGRIDITGMLKRPEMTAKIACKYDELTQDTKLNAIVNAALQHIDKIVDLDSKWTHRIKVQSSNFATTEQSGNFDWVQTWRPTSTEKHYEQVVKLSYIILQSSSLFLGEGETPARAFMLNMDTLFEHWVTQQIRSYSRNLKVESQYKDKFDTDKNRTIKPDIAIFDNKQIVAIADCKYKMPNKDKSYNGDLYQALAYATVNKLEKAWLIYCSNSETQSLTVKNTNIDIQTTFINLGVPIETAKAQMAEIAEHIIHEAKPFEKVFEYTV